MKTHRRCQLNEDVCQAKDNIGLPAGWLGHWTAAQMDALLETGTNGSGTVNGSSNGSGWSEHKESVFRTLSAFSVVIMAVGIPGNLLVILSVCLNKHLRSGANFLVLTLSVCDLVFLSSVVPVHTYTRLTGVAPLPKVCWVVGFLTNWFLGSSILSTGAIAINRYIAILLRSKYRQLSGNRAVAVTCTCVLTIPFLLLCLSFESSLGSFGFDTEERDCSWVGDGVLKPIFIVCVSIFPLVFMTLCYIRILLYVIASRKRVGALGQTSAFGSSTSVETRLSLMLAMVYIVYLVTTLPALVVNILGQVGSHVPWAANPACFTVVWSSSAANPVIYGFVNKKYKDAYKNIAAKLNNLTLRRTDTVETVETVEPNTR